LALVALSANLLAKTTVLLSPIMPQTANKIANALDFQIDTDTYNRLIVEKKLLDKSTLTPTEPLFPKVEKELMASVIPTKDQNKKEFINIDKFFACEIKIGTIIKAEAVEKSDKLLKLSVDLGEVKPRQIISGIKAYYEPAALIGTQVCVLANLKPAKIMGMESEGMILTAEDKNGLSLIRPENAKIKGAFIK
jgi:methionyl-tRNA synthetase